MTTLEWLLHAVTPIPNYSVPDCQTVNQSDFQMCKIDLCWYIFLSTITICTYVCTHVICFYRILKIEHGAVSNSFYLVALVYWNQEDDGRKKPNAPNFEAITEDLHIETMARKISAIHEEKTQNRHSRTDTGSRNDTNRLVGKANRSTRRLHLGHWPKSIVSNDTGSIQNWTGLNSDQRLETTIQPIWNVYHNRGEFFWTKQTETETPEHFWRSMIEIERECKVETKTAEEQLISNFKISWPQLPTKNSETN